MTQDDFTLPPVRPLRDLQRRRAALESELDRASRRLWRVAPAVAKIAAASTCVGVVVVIGALTLSGQESETRPAAPVATGPDPSPGQVLHLTTTIEKAGRVVQRIESWSSVGPPRRERIVIDDLDPVNPPTEYEVGGGYLTWRYDAADDTMRSTTRTEGSRAIVGSSGYRRRLHGIALSDQSVASGKVVIDGVPATVFSPRTPQDKVGFNVAFDTDTFRVAREEFQLPAEGPEASVRVTIRSEYLDASDEVAARLTILGAHPGARVEVESVDPGEARAEQVRRDLANDPAATTPDEVARSMSRGHVVLVGSQPSCRTVRAKVEYLCELRRADNSQGLVQRGFVTGIVDAKQRVSGGCRAVSSDGSRWRCYLGDEAITNEILGEGLLGVQQLVPAAG